MQSATTGDSIWWRDIYKVCFESGEDNCWFEAQIGECEFDLLLETIIVWGGVVEEKISEIVSFIYPEEKIRI